MVISMIDMFVELFSACAAWFGSLFESSGMGSLWLGAFAVWTSYRFLLKPLFGVAGSDSAKRSKRGPFTPPESMED